MGKMRKSHRFVKKITPFGAANAAGDEQLNSTGQLAHIRTLLQSASVEDKVDGLQLLANLVESVNEANLLKISQDELMRIVGPLFVEPDLAVRNAAAGVIRNLTASSTAVCENIVKADLLTPLRALLNEYISNLEWKPKPDPMIEGQLDLYTDIFVQALHILSNCIQFTSAAADFSEDVVLMNSLFRFLDIQVYKANIALAAAECVLIFVEANPTFGDYIKAHEELLLRLLPLSQDESSTYLSAKVGAMIFNEPTLFKKHGILALKVFSEVLNIDRHEILMQVTAFIESEMEREYDAQLTNTIEDADETEETEKEAFIRRRRQELPSKIDNAIEKVEYVVEAQTLCAMEINNVPFEECDITPSNVFIQSLKRYQIPQKMWRLAMLIDADLQAKVRNSSKSLDMKVKDSRIVMLTCLAKLADHLPSESFGDMDFIFGVWMHTNEICMHAEVSDEETKAATSLLRAVSAYFTSESKERFSAVTPMDLQLIYKAVLDTNCSEVRANWLISLANFGRWLKNPLLKEVMCFIMQQCEKEENTYTFFDTLDALMDMFSEDKPDIVCELKMLRFVKRMQKKIKTKVHQDFNNLEDAAQNSLKEVQENFAEFVKYIQNENYKIESEMDIS